MPKKSLWTSCKQWVKREGRVLLVSSAVAGGVIALRLSGLLQSWEWATLDQMSRLRPPEQTNQQIVIVEISETDLRRLGQWPVPDAVMARLLQKINAYQPRTIGLDIYRDLPVGSGYGELEKAFAIIPNLIGIERLEDPPKNTGVDPPRVLSQKNQVGFNNIVIDADGKVRRSLLYWYVDGKAHQSFALKLALAYLRPEGITSKVAKIDAEHEYLQLGKSVFRRFEENDGGYVRANAGAYQILANFHRHSSGFPTISMTEVLADRVPANLMRDRVVLIGSRASSQDDLFYTPLSSSLLTTRPIIGVELHANFICHILTAARQGEPIINSLPDLVEGLLILSCSWLGATICWRLRVPRKSAIAVFLMGASMTVGCYLAFLASWWLPLIPFLLAMSGSTVLIVAYIAHLEEELKRSKEFLQKVINTIADPIFVKNKQHRSIILNQAYCKFIGVPPK